MFSYFLFSGVLTKYSFLSYYTNSISNFSECRSKHDTPSLFPHSRGILSALKDEGIDAAIASKSPTPHIATTYLDKLKITSMFVAQVCSSVERRTLLSTFLLRLFVCIFILRHILVTSKFNFSFLLFRKYFTALHTKQNIFRKFIQRPGCRITLCSFSTMITIT